MTVTAGPGPEVRASVLVAALEGGAPLERLLESLVHQPSEPAFEVLVAFRAGSEPVQAVRPSHRQVQFVPASADASVPELRALAFERSRAAVIVIAQESLRVPQSWVARLVDALEEAPPRIAAVGGLVDRSGCGGRASDWAAFLCDYGEYLPPQQSGEVVDLLGANVAYRRSVLEQFEPSVLRAGLWEDVLHPRLRERGYSFLRLADVRVEFCKQADLAAYLTQRYQRSRHRAAVRMERHRWPRRVACGALSVARPPLLLSRCARCAFARSAYRKDALRALPALSCLALAHAVGEAAGYLFGPGDPLREVD